MSNLFSEGAVPEQMFVTPDNPGEAISAVKALAKANASGQHIYHITKANEDQVLPLIHHSTLVMQEIKDALAAGKEVITHTDAVSVPGWSGAGYIVYDPQTGSGAYKIAGGENGSWEKIVGYAKIFSIIALATLAVIIAASTVGLVAAIVTLAIQAVGMFSLADALHHSKSADDFNTATTGAVLFSVLGLVPVLGPELGELKMLVRGLGILMTPLTNPFGWFQTR